jgi:hypothetical protein
MSNKNLFKEAIADAKAVREAALANAKVALEEALTPKLQSMLAAKLNEMDEEMEEEGFHTNQFGTDEEDQVSEVKEDELDEDFDLSEILAELNDEEELEEAKEEKEESEEEESEEESVAEMSINDLKALIKDIVGQEIEAEEAETPADEEAEEAGEEKMDMGSEEMPAGDESDEIDLEELLAELDALGENEEEKELEEAKKKKVTKAKEEEKELKEAISVINTLRSELNEVNLLNAKLLYVNKIFKAKNLTESQKLTVIASFDKATTAKEAKVVFESLNANLNAAPAKKAIKESMGFASKAIGTAPNKVIVESNDIITRMQKLANIIK